MLCLASLLELNQIKYQGFAIAIISPKSQFKCGVSNSTYSIWCCLSRLYHIYHSTNERTCRSCVVWCSKGGCNPKCTLGQHKFTFVSLQEEIGWPTEVCHPLRTTVGPKEPTGCAWPLQEPERRHVGKAERRHSG